MSTNLTVRPNAEAIERVVIQGDLSKMNPQERVEYYQLVCASVGLNPLTKPFEYITLNGKLTLYARKDATDQLRSIHQVSVKIVAREVVEGCYVVTAQASFPSGRVDESIGAVPIENLKGEARANALMKCETKAKRRVTLSACGLGMLDETEIETIPSAKPEVERTKAPIEIAAPPKAAATADVKGAEPQTAAKTPQAVVPEVLVATREPGDDFADECIDTARQRALHRAFADAIKNEEARKHAKDWLRDWLKGQGYVDAQGFGTTKTIPMLLFEEVKAGAVRFAESLPG